HDWSRPRQEHVPLGRPRSARRNRLTAEALPRSARAPARECAALPDRHGSLLGVSLYRAPLDWAGARRPTDPGAVRQTYPQRAQERLPRRRGNSRSSAAPDHALRVDQDAGADGPAGIASGALTSGGPAHGTDQSNSWLPDRARHYRAPGRVAFAQGAA